MNDLFITALLVFTLFVILGSGVWIGLSLSGVAWVGMQLFSSRPAGDAMSVTMRKQNQLLGQTPAAFISSSGDLKALQAEFNLKAEPDSEGLQWVKATPKQSDGAVQVIRVGLKLGVAAASTASNVPVLTVLEIGDGLGQTSRLNFQNFEANVKLPPETFQFKAPAGVQVIRP